MNKKRFRSLFLCIAMVLSLVLFCACQNEEVKPTESADSGELDYKVTVVDGSGAPYTEKIVVKFMQGEEQIAMIPVDADGVAQKALPKGDYTVDIMSTDPDVSYYFDRKVAVLSADSTELELVLAKEMGQIFETVAAGDATSDAYYVSEGTTHVAVAGGDRNYFLFVPQRAGTYELFASDESTIGIYGGSVHFILAQSTHEMVDGKIQISVQPSMIGAGDTGTTVYVIGLDVPEGTADVMLNVYRTGEPGWSFTEEPWMDYQPKNAIQPFVLPEGTTLEKFDLTADASQYELVLNQTDGYYHLGAEDGPMVFVQLSEPMYGISLMGMVGEIVYQDGVLMQTGSAPFRYSYDNGQEDFFKEDYTDAMREFVTARDKDSGVYPLNEDLYYMLPLGVEANGWCREETANFLFRDLEGFNAEIGWMFLLMHEDLPIPGVDVTDPTEPPTDPPDDVTEPTDPIQATKPTQTTAPTEEPDPTEPTGCSHQYRDASCTSGKICKLCGETTGKALGHDFNANGKCKACGQKVVEDNKSEPELVASKLEFDVEVKAGHLRYYEIMRVSGTTFKLEADDAFVIYKKKVYKAEDGVVCIPDLQSDNINSPVEIAIGSNGPEDVEAVVKLSYPSGTLMNPIQLKMGSFTTNIVSGNDQGVYYTYTASSSGTLTLSLDDHSAGVDIGITLYNETSGQYMALESMTSNTVSVQVSKGDVVQIIICTLPDEDHKYPAATVTTSASFD